MGELSIFKNGHSEIRGRVGKEKQESGEVGKPDHWVVKREMGERDSRDDARAGERG